MGYIAPMQNVQSLESDDVGFIHNYYRQLLMERNEHNGSMFCGQQNIDAENGKIFSFASSQLQSYERVKKGLQFSLKENCSCGESMIRKVHQLSQRKTDPEGNGIPRGTHVSQFPMVMSKILSLLLLDLKRWLLKQKLCVALWIQNAHREAKLCEHSAAIPLDVRLLESQNLLLLASGDVERNPGPLTSRSLTNPLWSLQ